MAMALAKNRDPNPDPNVRNTTEFPEWKGRDDWKKEEQESFHAHAYAEKRHKVGLACCPTPRRGLYAALRLGLYWHEVGAVLA